MRRTANLERSLDPGERVVYRTRGRSVAPIAIFFGVSLLVLGALPSVMVLDAMVRAPDAIDWKAISLVPPCIGGLAAMAVIVLLIAAALQRRNPDDFMITDRRILFADNYWVDWIALSQVEQVSWAERSGFCYPAIIGDGQTIWLSHLRDRDAAVTAIADATGIAKPPVLGHLAVVNPTQIGYVVATGIVFASLYLLQGRFGLPSLGMLNSLDGQVTFVIIVVLMLGLASWLGRAGGALATVTIMRPFATPEQMQARLRAGQKEKWQTRIALKWASMLYRQPMPYLPG